MRTQIIYTLLGCLLLGTSFNAGAGTKRWTGGTYGTAVSWSSENNWESRVFPTISDDVIIDSVYVKHPDAPTLGGRLEAQTLTFADNFNLYNATTIKVTAGTATLTLGAPNSPSNTLMMVNTTSTPGSVTFAKSVLMGSPALLLGRSGSFYVAKDSSLSVSIDLSDNSKHLVLTKEGEGRFIIAGNNLLSGIISISAGTLAVTAVKDFISSGVVVGGGAALDVSGRGASMILTDAQSLTGAGTAAPGILRMSATAGVTLGTASPLKLACHPGTPALTVMGGALTLGTGNPVTVTVANGGVPLGGGEYILVSKGSGGAVVGTVSGPVTVDGDGLVSGATAGVAVVDGELRLMVDAPCEQPSVGALSVSPALPVCAGTTVSLAAQVSGGQTPYSYQWSRNGAVITGATGATLEVPAPVAGDEYSCEIQSACGGAWVASPKVTLALNQAPVAENTNYTRAPGLSLKLRKSALLGLCRDAEGDPLVFLGVTATNTGATVSMSGDYIFYTAANELDDRLSYTVSDGCGGNATGWVTVRVQRTGGAVVQQLNASAQGVRLTFAGIPGFAYEVERAGEAGFRSGVCVWRTNAPASGVFSFTDEAPLSGAGFYRLRQAGGNSQ